MPAEQLQWTRDILTEITYRLQDDHSSRTSFRKKLKTHFFSLL